LPDSRTHGYFCLWGARSCANLATMVEQGADSKLYELRGFTCFAAPAATPADIVKKVSDTIVAGRDDPKVKETMNQFFLNPPIPHAEAQKLFAEHRRRCGCSSWRGWDQGGVRGLRRSNPV